LHVLTYIFSVKQQQGKIHSREILSWWWI